MFSLTRTTSGFLCHSSGIVQFIVESYLKCHESWKLKSTWTADVAVVTVVMGSVVMGSGDDGSTDTKRNSR